MKKPLVELVDEQVFVNTIKNAKSLWIFQRETNGYTTITRADNIPHANNKIRRY